MSDGTTLSTNVGTGDKIATDDLGAVGKAQWVKLMDGTDGGTDVIPGTAASGLRVDPTSVAVADGGTLPAKGLQIGGTDGSVFQVMSTDNAGRPNVNVNGTVPVSGPLTDTQLRATAVPVSGTVTASGPLTDTQLRATAVPVSGSVTTGGLTDTQLRATAVPVSGTVTANAGTGTFTTQPVPVNTISTANSTTSVLSGAAAFTGTSEDISGYAIIFVTVFTSHTSATDGLSLQQSSDGTNWDITDTYTVPATSAGQGKTFSLNPGGKFFRLVYTNGATLQTTFRLQTIYKRFYSKPSSQRPADAYSNEVDLEQVNTFPMMWNGATWDRLTGVAATGLKVNGSGVTQPVSGTVTANAGTGPFPVSDNAGSLTVDAPVGTPAFVRLSDGSAAITTLPVSLAAAVAVTDNSGSLTVDAPVGAPVFVTTTPSTTGGWSKITALAQTTTKKVVKASAGTFGGYYYYNPNASVAYIQVFDLASGSVTLGTTAPDLVYAIPALSAANIEIVNGVNMANAITLACTTTATGLTAPGTGLDLTLYFK